MAKTSLMGKLRQLRLSSCGSYILGIVTIIQFFSYGTYNYTAEPISSIDKLLFKEVNPNLVIRNDLPECSFKGVVSRTKSIESWQIPEKYDDFSPAGVVNGSYMPLDCNPQISVAILVTYRNRQNQLDMFLPYMHNFLRKQNIHYKIYLIEQQDEKPWNKGLLYNIGAKYAMADKFPCLILHDVDLLPLDEGNLYACLHQPRHLSASIDKFRDVLTYPELVGGVLAIKSDQFVMVNGFSNRFEHWGGEDDDFQRRLHDHGLQVYRLPRSVSRYTMSPHRPEKVSPVVWRVLAANRAAAAASGPSTDDNDGLKHIHYNTLKLQPHRLFTLIGVYF